MVICIAIYDFFFLSVATCFRIDNSLLVVFDQTLNAQSLYVYDVMNIVC